MAEAGYLSPKAVFIDGTHIKANANTKKQMKVQIPVASKHYAQELMEEVNADRESHGKKPFDDDGEPPTPPKKRRDNTSKKKLARRKKEKLRTVTPERDGSGQRFVCEGENTSGSLLMRPIPSVTSMALCWRPSLPPGMYMTVWPLMKCMTV